MMFDVLMYLFENYVDGNLALKTQEGVLVSELEQAGFQRMEINRALSWLEGLNRVQKAVKSESQLTLHAMRHFSIEEDEHIGIKEKGFLLYLEQLGIIDPITREIVIDRLMALNKKDVDVHRVKWVILIALFNQPDKKSVLSLLQEMILSDAFTVLH